MSKEKETLADKQHCGRKDFDNKELDVKDVKEKIQEFIDELKEDCPNFLFELSGTYDKCNLQKKDMLEFINKLAKQKFGGLLKNV